MYALEDLQKQQVGLRLPKYLIDEIDEFTKEYSLNRSEIITESIKAFIAEQKQRKIYESFDKSCKELKSVLNTKDDTKLKSLDGLINELAN
jgi:metal-responsive CopG/Arc/MetJ family transcriptional regulator